MIHDREMGDNQAIFVGLHFRPCEVTRGSGPRAEMAAEGRALHTQQQKSREGDLHTQTKAEREENDR